MATVAILKSLHSLDNRQFIKGLSDSQRRSRKASATIGRHARRMGRGFRSITSSVFNLRSAIGVLAGSAGIGLLVRSQMQAIDTTAKFSRMIGESTREISGLQHAAQITAGVADKEFRMAFQRMTRRIAEASQGTGEAKKAIAELGLEAEELAKAGPAAAFKEIATAIQGVEDPAQRVRIAFKLFDSEGAALVNTLNAGTEEIERLQQEADRLGKTFTEIDAQQVEAANDAITRMSASLEGMQTRLAVDLAPLISGVADEITAMADEADGFQKQFGQAGRFALDVIGALADGIHTLQIAFKGVELVAVGFNSAVATAVEGVLEMLVTAIDTINGLANEAIAAFNKIPGVDIPLIPEIDDSEFMRAVRGMGHAARETVGMVRSDLHDMLMEPLPSETIDEFVKRAQETAAKARGQTGSRTPTPEGGGASGGMEAADEMAKQQKRLDAIRQGMATEMELEQAHFEREQEFLATAHETLFESEAERKLMIENLEREHQNRLFEIQAQGQGALLQQTVQFLSAMEAAQQSSGAAQVGIMSNAFAQITAVGAQHSRKMFELNKVAGIANAIIATQQGAAEALKLGWPMGPIAAAAIIANGMAKVQAIRSQSFQGGGGAAPSTSAGGGVPAVQDVSQQGQGQQQQTQNVTIQIAGDDDRMFSKRQMRRLLEEAQEELGDDASIGTLRIA